MKVNDKIICGVAPGWIFAGVVTDINEQSFTLSPAVWIEGLNAPWPEAAKDRKKVTTSSPIPRLTINLGAWLWDAECSAGTIGASELKAIEDCK
jgi:hypothetical protein